MKTQGSSLSAKEWARSAFTLIELLVVIAIIGILAALIANLSKSAADKRKIARVQAEMAQLETVIDNYQEKLGSYPPDNGNLVNEGVARPSAATNQLFYELAGAAVNAAQDAYTSLNGEVISKANVQAYFKKDGISNSQGGKPYFAPKENQYKSIGVGVKVLVVPVELVPGQINPWRYDASSTNRHNLESYDLWAEFLVGGKTNIVGNWKE